MAEKKAEVVDRSDDRDSKRTEQMSKEMEEEIGIQLRKTLRQWIRSWRKEWQIAACKWIDDIKIRCSIGYSLLATYDSDHSYLNTIVVRECWVNFPTAEHNRTFICTTEAATTNPSTSGAFKFFCWIDAITTEDPANKNGITAYSSSTSQLLRYRVAAKMTAIPENLWVGLFMCVTKFFGQTFGSDSPFRRCWKDVIDDGIATGDNYLCIRPNITIHN